MPAAAEVIARLDAADPEVAVVGGRPTGADWVGLDHLLGDEARVGERVAVVLGGAAVGRRDVTAAFLSSWIAGAVASLPVTAHRRERRLVGVAPADVAVRFHPEGWVDGVALLAPRLVVLAGDPAVGEPGVEEVPGEGPLLAALVDEVVGVATPTFAALRALRLPFGIAGMWGQLADAIAGAALADARRAGADLDAAWSASERMLGALAARVPELRARPRRQVVRWAGGAHHVSVKGTCCLWYKTQPGADPCGEGYCTTCPLRPDHHRAARLTALLTARAPR